MDDSELITATRLSARIATGHADYTDARMRLELTDALHTVFPRLFVTSAEGYWKQAYTQSITSGTSYYPMHARAISAGAISVEVRQSSSSNYYYLRKASQEEAALMDAETGSPTHYIDMPDGVRLLPSPTDSNWSLRIQYHIRPSKIVQKQLTSGVITAINTTTRVALMATTPTDRSTGSAITSSTIVDVVSAAGNGALHVVSASLSALTSNVSVTFASGTDLTRVGVGDFVRAYDQSEWPMLPIEFHRTLADACAAMLLKDRGERDKAEIVAAKVGQDLERLQDILNPRVKDGLRTIRHRFGLMRSGRPRGSRWGTAPV